ncbi:4a-hydroxytetrahydrobiopterin dehydratase [Croceitalea sp. MTPC9]|uniref:4a-hydroxytetrahydrobiopterin dehydratase n=1 Tax=unclassified Croceitalea TaxID=2632280 RepID=UPI002B36433B|nr:4a-hydroxytetrahydrobiopterin dehydratase [Croceitalea sp. MTPC6]GMN16235.1 4a-hydroxytetrahydrobiopterin dehydratase [Croceitalea sp. MTPC9]
MEKLSEEQIREKLSAIDGWIFDNVAITKSYKFKNFKEAFAAMSRIAFECEAQNHHPNWENVYNSLTIKLNTHDVDGVTQKDFDLATIIEKIINQ